MTDRELLELAAKAAGHSFTHALSAHAAGKRPGPWIVSRGRWRNWNPLTDDGDALRLAVALGMNVALIPPIIENSFCEIAAGFDSSGWPDVRVTEQHGNDYYAATRRAIVRAAAEIGRNMLSSEP